ncbi:hypothetical protein [Devosia sp.]|uniref:hypothetical protein n=1 Tax=Devosia sp. TaxID=1871048 RepID=UPI0026156899|nr:hypothetical protein [Devosia sp.]
MQKPFWRRHNMVAGLLLQIQHRFRNLLLTRLNEALNIARSQGFSDERLQEMHGFAMHSGILMLWH